MKVQVKGRTVNLGRRDFLASGGEGSVYVKGYTAYKIYTDPTRMIPAAKISELAVLSYKNIIKPEDVIFSRKKPVGYTMRFVRHTYSLCQLFTKAFKDRHKLTPEMCYKLVKSMQQTVDHIHSNGILIVDLNEMNFLSNSKFTEIYFIDVDSYQTRTYPATALMESVRDRHNTRFSENTDWFSFAVVTFQLMIGIHPYKGKHPTIKGLDARMEKNISVFDDKVRVPKSCMPFKIIPQPYLRWYKAVFDKGLRESPPTAVGKTIAVADTRVVVGSDKFKMKKLFKCAWDIHQYTSYMQSECLLLSDAICFNRIQYSNISSPHLVAFYGSTPIAAQLQDGKLILTNIKMRSVIPTSKRSHIEAEKLMTSDGRLYAKAGDNIIEIQFLGYGHHPWVGQKVVGKVMDRATQLFQGVAIQNMLGAYYASTFPASGQCVQTRLEFLEGYRIVEAKYEKNILMVIGVKKGKYDRFVFNIDTKELREIKDISNSGLNYAVMDNGIVVCIDEQDRVEVFHKAKIKQLKIIDDQAIHGGMRLFTDGGKILVADGKTLYSMRMK